ncbi:alpha/beta fold hydrolase [Curtobacterium flaccumfaciens]|nr:alpha/beta fold hydrolase [Curtobacterium flaccumfaciens]
MVARIPGTAMDAVVAWVDDWAPAIARPTVPPRLTEVLDVDSRVSERIVRLGPDKLFAIETVASGQTEDAPVVVLHNGAAEHRVGAADYQVALARGLARDGARVVRVDRRGTGESSTVHEDERSPMFTQDWVDDQSAVVGALGVPPDRLVLVGMCAGAWLAGRSADVAPRLVVEISPNDYRRVAAAAGAYADALRAIDEPSALRLRVRGWWNRAVPKGVRERVARRDRVGGVVTHLRPLVEQGTDVVVIASPADVELLRPAGRPAGRTPLARGRADGERRRRAGTRRRPLAVLTRHASSGARRGPLTRRRDLPGARLTRRGPAPATARCRSSYDGAAPERGS